MPTVDVISGDRRVDKRYAHEMPLRYAYEQDGAECVGSGYTRDLGRKGICFISEDPLPLNAELQLRIDWPFLLQNVCPLELRVSGRVLRSDDRGTVVRMSKYEFHTCGARSFDQASARVETWSIVA